MITKTQSIEFIETDGTRYRVSPTTKGYDGLSRAPRSRVLKDGTLWLVATRDWIPTGHTLARTKSWPVTEKALLDALNGDAHHVKEAAEARPGRGCMTHLLGGEGAARWMFNLWINSDGSAIVEDKGFTLARFTFDQAAGKFVLAHEEAALQ